MIIFETSDSNRMEYTPPRPRQAVPVNGILRIENANPAVNFEWRVSRGALIRMSLRCLWASVQRG
jgi:hypothetical protein